jgi:AIPR protein
MFLGDTSVNETLIETMAQDPEKFWYFNNGITALCSSIEKKPLGGGARQTGLFECRDFRIVNGAQTAGAIASAAAKYLTNVAQARVPIRIISLENTPESLEREITRYNNTQNRIERRDFAALDPEQERIRTELQLEEVSYTYKSGDLMGGEIGCDLADATVARACEQSDLSYAVQAKREIGRLWEDTDKAPYRVLFNPSVSGLSIWKSVQTLRIIDDKLTRLERDIDEGSDRLLAIHGNRFIAHLVFASTRNELAEQDRNLSNQYKLGVEERTRESFARLTATVNGLYPDSYLASLFKNGKKCQIIKDEYLQATSDCDPRSPASPLRQQSLFVDDDES